MNRFLFTIIASTQILFSDNALGQNFVPGGEIPVDIGSLGGPSTVALTLNDIGQVGGYSYLFVSANIRHAFVWDSTNGFTDLGTLGRTNSATMDINNNGVAAGFTFDFDGSGEAFIWDAVGGTRALPGLGGSFTIASGINDNGDVVGWGQNASGVIRGFVWSEVDGMTELGTFGGTESYAYAVSNEGRVVGTAQLLDGSYHPFVWDPINGLVDMGVPGEATAINADGTATGVYETLTGEVHAFVWNSLVFETDFENGLPPEVTLSEWGIETMESGNDGAYSNHGFSASQFCVMPKKKGTYTFRVSLTGLAPHTSFDLDFLLAAIDKNSDDDTLEVRVDGVSVFNEAIAWDSSAWSPAAPILLFENLELGYKDNPRGYDKGLAMGLVTGSDHSAGVDFSAIPHVGPTLTIDIIGTKSKGDRSYAIDDLRVILNNAAGLHDLGTLGGGFSIGRGINDAGTVVGLSVDAVGDSRAFLWTDAGGMQDMNQYVAPGLNFFLMQAWDINAFGDVTGEFFDGFTRGFLLED